MVTKKLAKYFGIPGFAPENAYKIFCLTFWLSTGVSDRAMIFDDTTTYFSKREYPWWLETNEEIQEELRKSFHDAGEYLIISAFGATEFPNSVKEDPVDTCEKIAD